ncbi:MAG: hydroxymethylglutaryl-CoA reductase, degradative [Anaerolineaceae bacterium]|nr:hydroxymethylglutaryl-CoA reductase, degradative [Anaerolineaceae bacterium]
MQKSTQENKPIKFYNLSVEERRSWLAKEKQIEPALLDILSGENGLTAEQADHMIENVIGTFALPLGLAQNFIINGREVLIPMVIEEPSVVAGASFMAKLAAASGGFTAHTTTPEMIAQIQVLDTAEIQTARFKLLENREKLLEMAATVDPVLQKLGGGPRDLQVRLIEDSPIGSFLVIHLIFDVRDAMGANAVNTAAERLAPEIEAISGGRVHLRILSNLADRRLARARATFTLEQLAFGEYSGEEVRDGIIEAWAFAASDPYRAATHNKGIMNGIDPVVIATGNDWRAVEAGAHAYAARSGKYTSLTTWAKDEKGNLVGTLEMPMTVGIVGGATRVHPAAKAALQLMNVKTASDLAEIIVSVGLAQNLAALRALATEGIQRGHMTLHARQVAIAAGAEGEEITKLAVKLASEKNVRIDRASEILANWRKQ